MNILAKKNNWTYEYVDGYNNKYPKYVTNFIYFIFLTYSYLLEFQKRKVYYLLEH